MIENKVREIRDNIYRHAENVFEKLTQTQPHTSISLNEDEKFALAYLAGVPASMKLQDNGKHRLTLDRSCAVEIIEGCVVVVTKDINWIHNKQKVIHTWHPKFGWLQTTITDE